MTRHLPLASVIPLLLSSATALAHPGHEAGAGLASGFAHPLLGADHLLAMLAVGLWAAQLGGRAIVAVPAAFVAAMLAGGALGFTGVALPQVEPLIAASVLALGLLVALRVRLSAAAGMLLVAGFAVAHGAAHAAEMAPGQSAPAYALGFGLATLLLHAAGVALVRLRPAMIDPVLRARLSGAPIALAGAWLLAGPLLG